MMAMTLSLNASIRVVPETLGRCLRLFIPRASSHGCVSRSRYPWSSMVQRHAVSVRQARPEDARSVGEVHVASWRHAYRGLLPDEYLERLSVDDREATWRGAFADPDPKSGAVVAEAGGRIVGFASFGRSRDEDVPDGTGEVPAIYVEPGVLGTGVGRELFEAVTAALRESGFTRATLWVLEANASARRFYERAGWSWDGSVSTHMFDCANEPVVRYAVDL
jgi:GNAT superfamily N-acetyltransferase